MKIKLGQQVVRALNQAALYRDEARQHGKGPSAVLATRIANDYEKAAHILADLQEDMDATRNEEKRYDKLINC